MTEKQKKAIPALITAPTYSTGAKKAGISRKTLYKWLKTPEFKQEFDRQRDEVAAEALGMLSQGLTKAVDTLVGLLDHKDDRLRRLTAKNVIEHFLKHKQNEELEKRIAAIEQKLV